MLLIEDEAIEYSWALRVQEALVSEKKARPDLPDLLWLLSHPPVFTLGARKSSRSNVLNPGDIPIVEISRGGDVTYHDPGQIVGYLILSLKPNERDLHKVLFGLEEVILLSLQELGIPGHRVEGKTGVFVNNQKVCSIGIACRHWITYHGFALNIHSDLKNYQRINPCGLESSLMQNITITNEQETFLKAKLFQYATSIFGRESLKNGSTSIKGFLQTCSIIAPA